MPTTDKILNAGILIFDEVEVLDFCGPFEVLSVAGRIKASSTYGTETATAINVFNIAQTAQIVKARGNFLVQPHYTIENHPTLDILVVPGGQGTRQEVNNPTLIEWIERVSQQTQFNTSVCTGSFLLAKAGLLTNRPATTHWASLDRFEKTFPTVQVQRNVRWVDDGQIITSAGISAGIDMSLHLVERLFDRKLAQATAYQMEYYWQENANKQ